MKKLIAIISVVFVVIGCTSYRKYIPITLVYKNGEPCFVESPNLIDDNHVKNFCIVLDKYGEDYKLSESGDVLINSTLIEDKDLLYNYTKKALKLKEVKKSARSGLSRL